MKYWILAAALFSASSFAKGLSPYLPLQISPEIETYIEKLFAITDGSPLIKPYKAVDILTKAEQIKRTHPFIYRKLTAYLQRYKKTAARTHSSIELGYSSRETTMPNQRGTQYDDKYRVSTSGFYQPNPYFIGSLGVEKRQQGGAVHYASYLGFGYEYAQVEVGYREHWFSPFKDSAMLTSINAEPSPSITISNATPITSWGLRYELFYSELEKVESILNDGKYVSGKPELAGIHLSFNPLPFWSVGLNRTVQFGGGGRILDLAGLASEVVTAPEDDIPVDKDRGNHLASITTKLNLNLGMPVSVYAEYGGDTRAKGSSVKFGDETVSVGVFLPLVTDGLSLRYEFNHWSDAWYLHQIYPEGYSNNGNIIGHWAAGQYRKGENVDTDVHSITANWEMSGKELVEVIARTILNEENTFGYDTGRDLQVRYSRATQSGFWGGEFNWGRDVLQKSYTRLSLFYRW